MDSNNLVERGGRWVYNPTIQLEILICPHRMREGSGILFKIHL